MLSHLFLWGSLGHIFGGSAVTQDQNRDLEKGARVYEMIRNERKEREKVER